MADLRLTHWFITSQICPIEGQRFQFCINLRPDYNHIFVFHISGQGLFLPSGWILGYASGEPVVSVWRCYHWRSQSRSAYNMSSTTNPHNSSDGNLRLSRVSKNPCSFVANLLDIWWLYLVFFCINEAFSLEFRPKKSIKSSADMAGKNREKSRCSNIRAYLLTQKNANRADSNYWRDEFQTVSCYVANGHGGQRIREARLFAVMELEGGLEEWQHYNMPIDTWWQIK